MNSKRLKDSGSALRIKDIPFAIKYTIALRDCTMTKVYTFLGAKF